MQELWTALGITVDPDNGCADVELMHDGGMVVTQVDSVGDERRFDIEHDGDVFYSITRHDHRGEAQRWQYNHLSDDQLRTAWNTYFHAVGARDIAYYGTEHGQDPVVFCLSGDEGPCAVVSPDGNSILDSGFAILVNF